MDLRVGAYAVIVRNDQILLTHWNELGRTGWTLPGGGIEELETVQQAAVREIAEETGYVAELGELLGVDSAFVPPERRLTPRGDAVLHALRIVFTATVVGGELTHEVGGSSDEARWVPLAQLDSLSLVSLVPLALQWWRAGR